MIKSIIHAGGESTRLREFFSGPKALAPIGEYPLLWFHLQQLAKSKLVSNYVFTLRHQHEVVRKYIDEVKNEFDISVSYVVEPTPLGRAGVVRYGIEKGVISTEGTYLMSHPDDFIPVNLKRLLEYAKDVEKKGKCVIMIMARYTMNPFGVGIAKREGELLELKHFKEKPELPLIDDHYANTGMMLFMPEAMKEFENVPLDKPTHPEHDVIPKLTKEGKVAVFLVDRWISVNYASDYKNVLQMGSKKLLEFLNA